MYTCVGTRVSTHVSTRVGAFVWDCDTVRKILVSVKFVSAILGPEMGAPILWTPGKMRSFCRKNHVRKIPLFWGGFFWGGGECRFYFYGRADFSDTEKANFGGHSRAHLREHSREHLREPFRGSISGSYFAFASSVLH